MSQTEVERVRVSVVREPESEGLPLPGYTTPGAAGMDVVAALAEGEPLTIGPGERARVSTGLRIAAPPGYEVQIRPRSGLAHQHGLGMVNSPGTIDSDYRGIVSILLVNWGAEPVTIRRGDRIAQMVVAPVIRAEWIECGSLPDSERGAGGFGSTGIAS